MFLSHSVPTIQTHKVLKKPIIPPAALLRAMMLIVGTLFSFHTSLTHAQVRGKQLYLDDGTGKITILSGLGNGGGLFTFPSGGGTILTTGATVNITTLGTIANGTWQGTAIAPAYGGTGLATYTPYSILAGGTTATAALQQVSITTAIGGQVLTYVSASALPIWQNVAAGLTNPMSVAGQMIYGGTGGTPTALVVTTTNGSVLSYNTGTNTPAWVASVPTTNGGTGATTANAGFNALSPMSAVGDIIYGGTSGAATRLPGSTTNGYVLTYSTTTNAPAWAAASGGGSSILNQTTQQASSNFNISGIGVAPTFSGGDGTAGTALTVRGGNGSTGAGAALTLAGGTSSGTNAGSYVSITGSSASTSGFGGSILVTAGAGVGTNHNSGSVTIDGGSSTGDSASNIIFKVAPAAASGSTANASAVVSMFSGGIQLRAYAATSHSGAAILTVAEMTTGGISIYTGGANIAFTTPTAPQIVAALPGITAGMGFEYTIVNSGGGNVTLAASSGVTLSGNAVNQVVSETTVIFHVIVTATGTPAVTIY